MNGLLQFGGGSREKGGCFLASYEAWIGVSLWRLVTREMERTVWIGARSGVRAKWTLGWLKYRGDPSKEAQSLPRLSKELRVVWQVVMGLIMILTCCPPTRAGWRQQAAPRYPWKRGCHFVPHRLFTTTPIPHCRHRQMQHQNKWIALCRAAGLLAKGWIGLVRESLTLVLRIH